MRIQFSRVLLRQWIPFAFLGVVVAGTAVAQSKVQLPAVSLDHQFTGATLTGTWVTLRAEKVDFKADGTVGYQKSSGESRQGIWSVANGTLLLMWTGTAASPPILMTVTAFNNDRFRVVSLGGKAHAEFVRQSALQPADLAAPSRPSRSATASSKLKTSLSTSIRPLSSDPHLDDHGGPVADNPTLHVMYWDSDWDSAHSDPQFKRSNIDSWLGTFMSSDYFDKGSQYGIGSGSFGESNQNFFLFPDPGGTTDSLLIHLWATGMIETPGTGVPYPCSDNDVYKVMLPKSTTIDNVLNKTCSSFGAYHLFAPILVPPFVCGLTDLGGVRFVPYTIIPAQCATHSAGDNGFYTDFDELTMLMSHETVEAMTDEIDSFATSIPVIGDIIGGILGILDVDPAWYDSNAGNLFTQSEAADICESPRNPEVWLNNSLVAAYWSNSDNDCAAGPGVVRNFTLGQTGVPGGTPVLVNFDTRTPNVNAGGGFTIQVATNTTHSYSYPSPVNGPAGTRYVTSEPPASVNVTDTFSVTASYGTEYFLTVSTNPAAAAVGNASLTPSNWYDAGPFVIHADQDVAVAAGARYDFTSWSGNISGNTHDLAFTLSGPTNAVANYTLQQLINFDETGIPGATPWQVTVEGTPQAGPFPDWVNNGSTIHYSYEVVVPALTPGTCYVLTSVVPPSPFVVSAPATVLGTYATQSVPQSITNYKLVGSQPGTGALKYLTYTADLVNCGTALGSVTARLASLDPAIAVVPGFRSLTFSPVPANTEVPASDTFTILANPATVDFSKLQWSFRTFPVPPQANPGAPQVVKVGVTVAQDGSGSTNPSGVGTLTYSWILSAIPAGSRARLVNPTSAVTQFVPDVVGSYVLVLTVSNGTDTNSASVTVTATP